MTPRVAVVVPFRGDPAGYRAAAWGYLRTWWTERHPTWPVVRGFCVDGPWCKALAVGDALTQLDADDIDILAVVDADVMCDGLADAVDAVAGGAGWAIPHRRVHRLTSATTATVLAGGALPDPTRRTGRHAAHQRPPAGGIMASYTGVEGGGMVVLPLATYRATPLDPRFVGFGQEDTSWAHALTVRHGPPWRGTAPLWHLWHPPQPRMTRAVGSPDGLALYQRYKAATTKEAMAAILAELPAVVC